jgi:hypothetical protein
VTRQLLPIVGFGLLATLGVVIALIAAPDRRDLFLDLYLLALGGIAVIRLVGLSRTRRAPGERSEFDEARRPALSKASRIGERDKLAREVGLGMQTAFDFHFRLRPVLVEIARGRLAARGIKLEDEPRARGALGEEAWELLRPEREPPHDRNAPGLAADELGRVVGVLERIG